MLRTCEAFCSCYLMRLAPSKSCTFGYRYLNRQRCGLSQGFSIGNDTFPFVGLDESILFFGTPIAARKCATLKSSHDFTAMFISNPQMIFNSNLRIAKKIHAFKTFLIPSLDFTLQYGQLKVKDIEKMDNTLGSMVNKLICGSVPVAV